MCPTKNLTELRTPELSKSETTRRILTAERDPQSRFRCPSWQYMAGGDLGSPISAARDYLTSLVGPSKTFIGVSEAVHLVEFATPDQFAMHVLNLDRKSTRL